ncbi:MAG: DUF2789 domain-containing protein [Azonexus sp.]|jgi:hypothetical protein|nr:DUF2789 domain-containing protein [Betaproteobacteria bacterium]MBK8919093.1 DUF2789 domain-containing protein [Betaproteobacteria bacterium]MBP6036585.1 DUF2789 domain-containing protein [Azonexus sp.]MBP6907194.1 DUF2789 domain-containing protein [Azonexus sp.]
MGSISYDMRNLFSQLGQANDADSIRRFIESKTPMGDAVLLHEAAFWSASQANFLREALLDDAEWASVIDALNSELHGPRQTSAPR